MGTYQECAEMIIDRATFEWLCNTQIRKAVRTKYVGRHESP